MSGMGNLVILVLAGMAAGAIAVGVLALMAARSRAGGAIWKRVLLFGVLLAACLLATNTALEVGGLGAVATLVALAAAGAAAWLVRLAVRERRGLGWMAALLAAAVAFEVWVYHLEILHALTPRPAIEAPTEIEAEEP